jgi:cyclophilin family peptidyl-prolyl cis-trans isomerase
MSRKKRQEKRTVRQQQQRRLLIIGGVIVVFVAAIFVALLVYATDRENRRNDNLTATAVSLAGTEAAAAAQTLTPQGTEAALASTQSAESAEAIAPRQTALAPEVNAQLEAAATQLDEAGEIEPVLLAAGDVPSWDAPPEMSIDTEITYLATIVTEKGPIVLELFAEAAPVTVNNFVFLAREGYYDNTTFHRVIDDFMAQGGDPTGTGSGGPGYTFEDETDSGLVFDRPYLLAMANAGADTNGSQFFITTSTPTHLNGAHTIFGEVIAGQEVVDSLTLRDPSTADFLGDTILTIEITEVQDEAEQ